MYLHYTLYDSSHSSYKFTTNLISYHNFGVPNTLSAPRSFCSVSISHPRVVGPNTVSDPIVYGWPLLQCIFGSSNGRLSGSANRFGTEIFTS